MVTWKHLLCYWYGKNEESHEEAVHIVILTSQEESPLVSFYREVFNFCPMNVGKCELSV